MNLLDKIVKGQNYDCQGNINSSPYFNIIINTSPYHDFSIYNPFVGKVYALTNVSFTNITLVTIHTTANKAIFFIYYGRVKPWGCDTWDKCKEIQAEKIQKVINEYDKLAETWNDHLFTIKCGFLTVDDKLRSFDPRAFQEPNIDDVNLKRYENVLPVVTPTPNPEPTTTTTTPTTTTEPKPTTTPTTTTETTTEKGTNWLLIAGISAGALLIIIVIVYFIRKK